MKKIFRSSFVFSICFILGFLNILSAEEKKSPVDWTGITPEIAVPAKLDRDSNQGLAVELKSENSIGTWTGTVAVKTGTACRITAEAEIDLIGPSSPGNDSMIILSWMIPDKKNPCQRDYVEFSDQQSKTDPQKTIRQFDQIFTVPDQCTAVKIECIFKWRVGKAIFRNVEIATVPVPKPRMVRIVAANPHPSRPCTIEGNLAAMEETLKNIFQKVERPDIILFAECFTDSGAPGTVDAKAEPLPDGPTFRLLSRYARQYHVWIAGNIHEAAPEKIYHNTAFLVDRSGKLAGIYRKVHLTSSEFQKGVIPGKELPVFQTDFGKVAFVICWDNWFSETAKILRLKGAELLLFPLAGDAKESHWGKIWSARAIDSSVPMVVATQQAHLPSAIIDRDGEWLTETKEKNRFAWKDLDLNERKRSFWLSVGPSMGDPYQLYNFERRPSAY
ncbi:MAG: carbon-nitrogen hydrolase family protein [Planctomycetia bacterium]|nr:carbon-nitrogen hydrolase family protein [Planctomycetia bacterium]